MARKAAAFKDYTEAARVDMLMEALPKVNDSFKLVAN